MSCHVLNFLENILIIKDIMFFSDCFLEIILPNKVNHMGCFFQFLFTLFVVHPWCSLGRSRLLVWVGFFFFFSHARFFWFVYFYMFTLPNIYYFFAQHFSWFIDYTAHSHDLLLPHSAGVPKLPGLVNVYIAIVYMAQTFSRSHMIQPNDLWSPWGSGWSPFLRYTPWLFVT